MTSSNGGFDPTRLSVIVRSRDDKGSALEDKPNLISSTARYPSMNASENLVAAA
jgi:hypothetical protein